MQQVTDKKESSGTNLVFLAGGCNRVSAIADWSSYGLVYGCQNTVIILDKEAKCAVTALQGHSSTITVTRWLENGSLFSGDAEGKICCWSQSGDNRWRLECQWKAHSHAVNSLDSFICSEKYFIISVSTDATWKIFQREYQETKCFWREIASQNLTFLPESVSVTVFHVSTTKNVLLMAIGGTDRAISIFAADLELNSDCLSFQLATTKSIRLYGHNDWIRDVCFCYRYRQLEEHNILASGSQDSTIRVWKLDFHPLSNYTVQDSSSVTDIWRKQIIQTKSHSFMFSCEALLTEHEDLVCSVRWSTKCSCQKDNQLVLVSASCDQNVLLWSPTTDENIWLPFERFTSLGGAPCTTAGFFGAYISPLGDSVWAHGFLGQMYRWQWYLNAQKQYEWKNVPTVTGHGRSVTEICWKPVDGLFFATVSSDQTARIFLQECHESDDKQISFREIARPQVHGHDIYSLVFVSDNGLAFISAAEEKVIRLFHAPRSFIAQCRMLSPALRLVYSSSLEESAAMMGDMAALGLTNKAVYEVGKADNSSTMMNGTNVEDVVPTESNLSQATLWPEVAKLYGHASASQAQSAKDAAIIIWNIEKKEMQTMLFCHELTVTQLIFSPSGILLSVSRDRSFGIHREEDHQWRTLTHKQNVHQRILYSASWSPDERLICTASRDKTVKFHWGIDEQHSIGESTHWIQTFPVGVRSVCFAPIIISQRYYLIAVGLENGEVHWMGIDRLTVGQSFLFFNTPCLLHGGAVTSLHFQPCASSVEMNCLLLASASMDGTVRVSQVQLESLKKSLTI
eukprot:jgi/Galph1/2699/GphlegSOOS_G1362.1